MESGGFVPQIDTIYVCHIGTSPSLTTNFWRYTIDRFVNQRCESITS